MTRTVYLCDKGHEIPGAAEQRQRKRKLPCPACHEMRPFTRVNLEERPSTFPKFETTERYPSLTR